MAGKKCLRVYIPFEGKKVVRYDFYGVIEPYNPPFSLITRHSFNAVNIASSGFSVFM
jgi:hypothetical protein